MALNLLNLILFQSLAKAQNKEASPALSIAASILPGGLMGVAIPLIAAPSKSETVPLIAAPSKSETESEHEFFNIPDCVGADGASASRELQDLELNVKVIKAYHREIPQGKVFLQLPPGGTLVVDGNEVSIWISKGSMQAAQQNASVAENGGR